MPPNNFTQSYNLNYTKQPNTNQRNVANCNPEKCKGCSLSAICSKSPFNILNDLISNNKEQISMPETISSFNEKMLGLINVINPIIANIELIGNELKNLSDKTDFNMSEIKKELNSMVEKIDTLDVGIASSKDSLAVYEAQVVESTSKPLVAKKGLFGTKYVE